MEGSGTILRVWGLIRLISTILHSSHNPTTPIHVINSISIIWFCIFKNFSYICISKFRKSIKFLAKSCSREVAASFLTRGIRIHSMETHWSSLLPETIFRTFTAQGCSYSDDQYRLRWYSWSFQWRRPISIRRYWRDKIVAYKFCDPGEPEKSHLYLPLLQKRIAATPGNKKGSLFCS